MRPAPVIEITVPVYNEERVLEASISALVAHLDDTMPYEWRVVIADNASTDATRGIARRLAQGNDRVTLLRLEQKGRGRALKEAWGRSEADVVVYTDVDLSTGLSGLLPLIAPLVSGHSDLSVGSRLSAASSVARSPRREVISLIYNLLLRVIFAVRFRDAQCGFKAGRTDVVQALLPAVDDNGWFFDTELLLLAEHNGLRVHEVSVDWVDDPDTRVSIGSTALDDLRGIRRMFWRLASGRGDVDPSGWHREPLDDDFGRQTVTFGFIGASATAVSLCVFFLFRDPLGAVWANVIGFCTATIGKHWANQRWTFRHRRDRARWRRRLVMGALLALSLLGSSIAVGFGGGDLGRELVILLASWAIAAFVRVVVLRMVVSHPRP